MPGISGTPVKEQHRAYRRKVWLYMVKIIMVGCNGRMGQMITDIVKEDDDAVIAAGIDIINNRVLTVILFFTDISDCDVAADVIIDFFFIKWH